VQIPRLFQAPLQRTIIRQPCALVDELLDHQHDLMLVPSDKLHELVDALNVELVNRTIQFMPYPPIDQWQQIAGANFD